VFSAARKPVRRVTEFYRDPEYFRQLLMIGGPIAINQFAYSVLNMVGTVMIGQKGDVAMAAVGLAGQIFFLLNLFLFGIISGSAMVTAQLWGKKDIPSIRGVLALCLWMSLAVSIVFFALSEIFPARLLQIYTADPQVILLGSEYLRVFAGSFVFFAITFSFALVLRSTGNVRLPTTVSIACLVLNIVLSYLLIFGKLGLPALGAVGAAWAVFISRIVECVVLLTITYRDKSPVAASLRELVTFNRGFFVRVMKPILPVALNELLWSLGITVYNSVYGHIGTEAVAAINIMVTVESLAMALFMGISNATSVMVGNQIGAGEDETAYRFAGRSIGLAVLLAALVGLIVLLLRNPVIGLYRVSTEAASSAYWLMTILGLFLSIRMTNMVLIVGMLRGGGDTRFSLFLDGGMIWVLGVPMALLGAFVLHLSIEWVYLMVMSEEVAKWIISLRRYFTREWIHDLTHLSMANTD
jgi:putative MATE family efflux protein